MRIRDLVGGRYEIEAEVAKGGMGTVFRAADRRAKRQVAVKVLHDPAGIQRFEREAGLLASLDHPGIVKYLDHGQTDEGEPYLIMEWLSASSLSAVVSSRPLG